MVFKIQSILPYAASTAASAAFVVYCAGDTDVLSLLEYASSGSYLKILKLSLGTSGIWCCCFCVSKKLAESCRKALIRKLLTYRNWLYSPRSQTTKVWGALLLSLLPKDPPLYSLQELLPKYPLPTLEDTCKKTVETFKPLMNAKEFGEFERLMNQLLTVEGPPLQKLLEKKYAEEVNWLTPMWDKFAYLAGRSSIAIQSNFVCLGDGNREFLPKNVKQTALAASCIHHTLKFIHAMEEGQIDHMRIQKMIPICCERYKYMLHTTRVPHIGIDQLVRTPHSHHITLFARGSTFRLPVYAPADDDVSKMTPLTPREIQRQLDLICATLPHREVEDTSPAIFTTMQRDQWAKLRVELMEDPTNAESLESIETSIFCLTLSDEKPKSFDEELHMGLCGSGCDRWFDKSLNVFIYANNLTGFNVEHTTAEATLSGRLWEYVYGKCRDNLDAGGNATDGEGNTPHREVASYRKMEWKLDERQRHLMAEQRKIWKDRTANVDACVYFTRWGKETIKKLKLSPDGYMQMALQLAFTRLHGNTPKTYETAATRLYREGRTETIRPFSQHSVNFTKKMDDEKYGREEVRRDLERAIKHQTKYKLDAMMGMGVDRHLFGLYAAGKMSGNVPQVFTNTPALYESDQLSTSQSPLVYDPKHKHPDTIPIGGGFGYQRDDGYGLTYFFDNEDKVHFLCTSHRSHPTTGSLKFCQAVQHAMDDMAQLFK